MVAVYTTTFARFCVCGTRSRLYLRIWYTSNFCCCIFNTKEHVDIFHLKVWMANIVNDRLQITSDLCCFSMFGEFCLDAFHVSNSLWAVLFFSQCQFKKCENIRENAWIQPCQTVPPNKCLYNIQHVKISISIECHLTPRQTSRLIRKTIWEYFLGIIWDFLLYCSLALSRVFICALKWRNTLNEKKATRECVRESEGDREREIEKREIKGKSKRKNKKSEIVFVLIYLAWATCTNVIDNFFKSTQSYNSLY